MSLLTIGIIIYCAISFVAWCRVTAYGAYDSRSSRPDVEIWFFSGVFSFLFVAFWPISVIVFCLIKYKDKVSPILSYILYPLKAFKPIASWLFKKPKNIPPSNEFEYHPQLDD